uniref:Uncharacterized protein n=1 Tax=Romanomermis culicivorax TaxID=13658 RepID=A0A915IBU2_ROMCU
MVKLRSGGILPTASIYIFFLLSYKSRSAENGQYFDCTVDLPDGRVRRALLRAAGGSVGFVLGICDYNGPGYV